jgi:hypothetical protein
MRLDSTTYDEHRAKETFANYVYIYGGISQTLLIRLKFSACSPTIARTSIYIPRALLSVCHESKMHRVDGSDRRSTPLTCSTCIHHASCASKYCYYSRSPCKAVSACLAHLPGTPGSSCLATVAAPRRLHLRSKCVGETSGREEPRFAAPAALQCSYGRRSRSCQETPLNRLLVFPPKKIFVYTSVRMHPCGHVCYRDPREERGWIRQF